jgi:hypothetical protein
MTEILACVMIYLNLNLSQPSAPSRTVVLLWIKKVGYYRLHQPREQSEDWILILDESIGIGQEKLLIILGIQRSKLPKDRPLTLQDMTPLIVKSSVKWTYETIGKELEACGKQLGGSILYATTDGGNNIKKALHESGIAHVYDLTHALAVILSGMYEKDDDFKAFTQTMGRMRLKFCCSKYAHLIPPNQRSKSRFLNIDIVSKWGMKILELLEKGHLTEEEKQLLLWVKTYRVFIEEIDSIIKTITAVSILLKHKGLSQGSAKACRETVRQCKGSKKRIRFKRQFIAWLRDNLKHRSSRKESLLCTSDVIESAFGRYKNELNENPMSGITDMALIIPALTANLEAAEITKAIDSCTCAQLSQWRERNLCESLQAKKNKVFA